MRASMTSRVGYAAGAYAPVGGSSNPISLQPLTIGGNTGLNLAAGIARVALAHLTPGLSSNHRTLRSKLSRPPANARLSQKLSRDNIPGSAPVARLG